MSTEANDDVGGGDAACWAGLLCEECGVILTDGVHRPECSSLEH
ncbi:MAG: hypothetical protein WA359_00870 [Acidimicrobiales bacterium]